GGTSNPVPLTITAAPSAVTAQSNSRAALQKKTIDLHGKPPADLGPLQPMRFRGWNYGRTAGDNYLKFFSRAYGRVALHRANPQEVSHPNLAGGSANALTPPSLTQPSTLPGFALHPSLPGGFIPTAVVAGDFNRDGKMDWAVTNGGSNDVWVYF